MDFLVKWVGMDENFNRWLPWKELRNNSVLHKYLFDHGLNKLIPKEHRKSSYRFMLTTNFEASRPRRKIFSEMRCSMIFFKKKGKKEKKKRRGSVLRTRPDLSGPV